MSGLIPTPQKLSNKLAVKNPWAKSGEAPTHKKLSNYDKIVRKQCELSFAEFVKEAAPQVIRGGRFVWGRHIGLLCSHLQAVANDEIDLLLINLPPGCTKSTVLSVLWPAWVWTTNPAASFLCITYNDGLTLRDAIACRELIGTDWYTKRWGDRVQVKFGEDSKGFYRLTGGGWRMSTTRRGRATGEHPNYVIIDDPLSAEQAKVPNERKAFAEWYRDTLASRGMANNVKHVVGMQRLHVEDTSADFIRENELAEMAGQKKPWTWLRLPMRYDPDFVMQDQGFGSDWRTKEGELLYPELLDEEKVRKLEKRLGKANTGAQLGQNPQVRDGDFFLMTHLKVIKRTSLPLTFDAVVRFWDRAASDEGDGAYTAGALVAKKGDRIFLLDMIRVKLRSGAVENLIEQTCFIDENIYGFDKLRTCFEIEPGSGGKRQGEITIARLRGHRVTGVVARQSKESHAEPLSIAVENGEVFVVDGPYVPEVFHEMGGFPSGKYKDQTDAFAGAYLELVNPTSKAASAVLADTSSKMEEKARRAERGKCANANCSRVAFEDNGYCCDSCRTASAEGVEAHRHTAECHSKHNDWWVRNSKD